MPSASERQRKFMGMELGKLRAGKKTQTGMSEKQLSDFARKRKGGVLKRKMARRKRGK